MVPRTFPSSLHPFTRSRQLVAFFLADVAGLQRWVDYIPVNFGTGSTLTEGSYNNDGFIAVQELTSRAGLQAFLDYIPVFFDPLATDAWRVSANGFIPYGTSGVSSPPSLDISFTRSETIDSRITFTRASNATRFNSSGTLVTMSNNQPRFDYNPTTLQPRGLLMEEQRTNLVFPSVLPTSAAATIGRVNINGATTTTSGVSAPDGSTEGFTITGASSNTNTSGSDNIRIQGAITGATTYTFSIWVKTTAGQPAASIYTRDTNTDGGGVFLATTTSTWTRVSRTVTTAGASTLILRSDSGVPFDCFGLQIETGAFATSYIPTTVATATRAADAATMTGTNFSSWYNQTEGTLYGTFSLNAVTGKISVAASIDDATLNNFISLARVSGLSGSARIVSGGITQSDVSLGAISSITNYKVASAYKLNDFAASINGGAAGVDNSGSVPVVSQFVIGTASADANIRINGHIRQLTYYPRRLTNNELRALTS